MVQKKVNIEPVFSFDGLKQTSTRTITYANDEHGPTCFSMETNLPPYVLPSYWSQYSLSEQDIFTQSEFIPAQFYWLAALLYGIDASASSIHPSLGCIDEVLLSSKPIAIKKMLKVSKIQLSKTGTRLENTAFTTHKPPIPHVFLPSEEILQVSKLIFPGIKPFETAHVPGLFEWNHSLYLPIALEQDNMLLNRVVLETDYKQSGKQKSNGYASRPLLVESNQKTYALVEDVMLVSLQT